MPIPVYNNRPHQMAFHNLCSDESKLPLGTGSLLGLCTKFCIQLPQPKQTDLDNCLSRFQRDVWLKDEFANMKSDIPHIPKIYIKSAHKPKAINWKLEEIINQFHHTMRQEREKIIARTNCRSNLTFTQRNLLNTLQNRDDLITLICDKNLGPSFMEKEEYIIHILREHLNNGKGTYWQLSPTEAEDRMENFITKVGSLIFEVYQDTLSKEELLFFKRVFNPKCTTHQTSQFYGLPKIHKGLDPFISFRPVISQCGSFGAFISIFVD